MRRGWLVAAIVLVSTSAHADRITVKVVDVAGDVAYIEPGAAAGIVAGGKVTLGGVERVVIAVTESTASIRVTTGDVVVGQIGNATVAKGAAVVVEQRATPHPPDAFRDQWPEPARPADAQAPKSVPLGAGRQGGAVHVTVLGHGYGAIDKAGHAAQGEARVIASFDVLRDRPLAVDADVAARAFSDGYTKALRTPLFVRVAQLRYGSAMDPNLALGRLRFAASSVGMLDGGRAMLRRGDFEVAAFGGLVPDPLNGKPDTGAARFGGEAIYDAPAAAWQPRLALIALGSTWSGQVDERRLIATGDASQGALRFDGWAEAQQFPAGNPWRARAVEITGAGLAGEWRRRGDHVGLDLDFLRPERSLRLAAALPIEWLCAAGPKPGDVAETCGQGDYWTTASATGGLRRGRFVVDAIGSVGRSHVVTTSYTSSAYVRGEVHIDRHRLVLGGSAGRAEFAAWTAGELGVGTAITRQIDAEVRYRGELLDYVAGTKAGFLSAIAADVRYLRSTSFDVGVSALGTTGPDRTSVALLTTIVWRPLP